MAALVCGAVDFVSFFVFFLFFLDFVSNLIEVEE